MEKHQIIHKFRVENLSQKKGCGCKKKNFEEGEMEVFLYHHQKDQKMNKVSLVDV